MRPGSFPGYTLPGAVIKEQTRSLVRMRHVTPGPGKERATLLENFDPHDVLGECASGVMRAVSEETVTDLVPVAGTPACAANDEMR